MELNPFIWGRALSPTEFVGRKKELRYVLGRLASRQSTAIIGAPHSGKTSLLNLLADAATRQQVADGRFDHHLFSFLDAQALRAVETQAAFWALALHPLAQVLEAGAFNSVAEFYHTAQQNGFGAFVLEQLLKELAKAGGRLVLLLDEFDDFLTHPKLHSAEFYGSLRSLASRSPGLVVVIAARRELEQLNRLTQQINPHGSPYFNVFTEVRLGALSDKEMADLLAQGNLDQQDRRFVAAISGKHPFLAQAAAAMVWEAQAEGLQGDRRYRQAGERVYQETISHFANTWQVWTPETRKVITIIALSQIPYLVTGHVFMEGRLAKDLADYTPELEVLETSGVVAKEGDGQWQITQNALLWWLVDELRRVVRDKTDFGSWLLAQHMDGIVTREEKQRLRQGVDKVLEVVKIVPTLIEAVVKVVGG